MKRLFEKWFCKHKWTVHASREYRLVNANGSDFHETEEVLICEHCGKIKTITY